VKGELSGEALRKEALQNFLEGGRRILEGKKV